MAFVACGTRLLKNLFVVISMLLITVVRLADEESIQPWIVSAFVPIDFRNTRMSRLSQSMASALSIYQLAHCRRSGSN